jgi:D-glycero-D-manno-heptose 1,7-bisphosphate phosphatase
MNKAVFLDRDGVINQMIFRMGKMRAPYSLEEFAFFEGVPEAIADLKRHDFILVVVTNQPDVARGWVAMEQVELVNNYVTENLAVDEILACFHVDADKCLCRKPQPGMLLTAAKKWDIDLSQSFMVGDRISDVEAGHRAGCRGILVGTGEDTSMLRPDFECADLLEASRWIIKESV